MSLDQDKSFYCVIDGMVQVFAQTGSANVTRESLWDDEDMNGYQLLNEVGSGGTLSSLFTILSLFTEDVHISWQDEFPEDESAATSEAIPTPNLRRVNSDVSLLALDDPSVKSKGKGRRASISSAASTVHAGEFVASPEGALLSPDVGGTSRPQPTSTSRPRPARPTQAHRGAIARATEDSTLAVIPAEAFKRLTKQHPKATGHIVQGIFEQLKFPNTTHLTTKSSNSYSFFSRYVQRCPQIPGTDKRSSANGEGH